MSWLTVKDLYVLSKMANKTMHLTLPDGRQFSVSFDRANEAALETRQLISFAYPDEDDLYLINLRLIMV